MLFYIFVIVIFVSPIILLFLWRLENTELMKDSYLEREFASFQDLLIDTIGHEELSKTEQGQQLLELHSRNAYELDWSDPLTEAFSEPRSSRNTRKTSRFKPSFDEIYEYGQDSLRKFRWRPVNLTGQNWGREDLRGKNLKRAILKGTDFTKSDLSGAKLFKANLSGAFLTDALLVGAKLQRAVLSNAIMIGADLSGANLRYAMLQDANLTNAILVGADLRNTNLEGAITLGAKFGNNRSNSRTIWPEEMTY